MIGRFARLGSRPRFPRPSGRPWPTGLLARLTAGFTAMALVSSLATSAVAYQLIRRAILQRAQDARILETKAALSRLVPRTVPAESGDLTARIEAVLTRCGPGGCRTGYAFHSPPGAPLPLGERDRHHRLKVYVTGSFVRAAERGTVFRRVDLDGTPMLVIGARVHSAGKPPRPTPIIVFVTVSLDEEAADLRSLAVGVAVADAAVLLVAFALALAAARGVLRPVRRLGRAAERLGRGRLDARVAVTGRDELAALARTFNHTAGELERTVAGLRAMEAASRRFVADVSHELRTPLTAMTAVVDVLAEEEPAGADGGTAARVVAEQTRRLGILVEHLLEISRLDAGTASLVLDEVRLAEAVRRSVRARGLDGGVEISVPEGFTARADREHPPNTLYFLRDGRLVAVHRPGVEDDRLLVFGQLRSGPTEEERSRGMTSAVPGDLRVDLDGDRPRVGAPGGRPLSRPALAQLACTATAQPRVNEIEVAGRTPGPSTYTCADFRDLR
ncbi:HAMP domain-containing protein [Actinomadura kijaniata]|uniref:HAMP domain-containing protein n=1 Tax=Actinomadura kijaniata TaxID=46161 RepID=UPI003F1C1D12